MSLQLRCLATSCRDRDHCSPHCIVHNHQNGSSQAVLKIAMFVRQSSTASIACQCITIAQFQIQPEMEVDEPLAMEFGFLKCDFRQTKELIKQPILMALHALLPSR